ARSSATMSASVRDQMPKPSCVSCQLGSPTTTRFTRTRLSDIVHPVSSSQLTQDPNRVRSFGGYNMALRLFLPESWTSKRARLERAVVPAEYRTARTKPEMALAEIDRAIAAGVRFGCILADAGYGLSAPFRQGLTARKLIWAVDIPRHLKVYPADVQM